MVDREKKPRTMTTPNKNYNTLNRKLNIEQHQLHIHKGNACAPEGLTVFFGCLVL